MAPLEKWFLESRTGFILWVLYDKRNVSVEAALKFNNQILFIKCK